MVDLRFNNYIGIDYSGAKTSLSRLAQLQIYIANPESNPIRIDPPEKRVKNWCRKELTFHLKEILKSKKKTIIGIDHGLSFPYSFYKKNKGEAYKVISTGASKTKFNKKAPQVAAMTMVANTLLNLNESYYKY